MLEGRSCCRKEPDILQGKPYRNRIGRIKRIRRITQKILMIVSGKSVPSAQSDYPERSLQQVCREFHLGLEAGVADIRVEEKKRGAPWVLILLLLIVAAVIGWWLWSNRSSGSESTSTPAAVTDSVADTTRTP